MLRKYYVKDQLIIDYLLQVNAGKKPHSKIVYFKG